MTGADEALVAAAARNNAAWCDTVCRSHGLAPAWDTRVWSSSARTPPLYPDAVTLRSDVDPGAVIAGIDLSSPGATVKDSFGTLELTDHGLVPLFDAAWIHRTAAPAVVDAGLAVEIVDDGTTLERWVRTWHGDDTTPPDVFRLSLVDDVDVRLLLVLEEANGAVLGGAAVNRAGTVAGLSNVFTEDGAAERVWGACLVAASTYFPGLDLVGYESGDDLEPALANGFRTIGPLRIWIDPG